MSIYKGSQKVMGIIASQGEADLTEYQKKNDSTLNTTDKTVSGAINELKEAIDSGTGTEVPSPNIVTYSSLDQLSLTSGTTSIDILNALPDNSLLRIEVADNAVVTDIPENVKGVLIIDKNSSTGINIEYKVVGGELYIGLLTIGDTTTLTWKRVCVTNLKDTTSGYIWLNKNGNSMPSGVTTNSGFYVNYTIKNGWCQMLIGGTLKTSNTVDYASFTLANALPKPNALIFQQLWSEENLNSTSRVIFTVTSSGGAQLSVSGSALAKVDYWNGIISYPVKES